MKVGDLEQELEREQRCEVVGDAIAEAFGTPAPGAAGPLGDEVARALMRRPHDVPALLSIARDTWLARRSLSRAMKLLGDDLGLPAHEHAAPAQVIELVGDELLAGAP